MLVEYENKNEFSISMTLDSTPGSEADRRNCCSYIPQLPVEKEARTWKRSDKISDKGYRDDAPLQGQEAQRELERNEKQGRFIQRERAFPPFSAFASFL